MCMYEYKHVCVHICIYIYTHAHIHMHIGSGTIQGARHVSSCAGCQRSGPFRAFRAKTTGRLSLS